MDFSLDTHPKNTNFDVPNGYFDSLSEQIMSRVQESERKRVLVRKRWITTLSVASSLALLVVAGFLFYDLTNTPSTAPLADGTPNNPSKELVVPAEVSSQETEQPEVLFAKNEINNSNSVAANIAKESTEMYKTSKAKAESTIASISDDELEDIEYQMLENFSDEIAFNEWWEL